MAKSFTLMAPYDATDFMGGSKAARVHGKNVARLLGVIGSKNIADVVDFLNRNRRFVWEDIYNSRAEKRNMETRYDPH